MRKNAFTEENLEEIRMFGVQAHTRKKKAGELYAFLTMPTGHFKEVNLFTGRMGKNPLEDAIFKIVPELITFSTDSEEEEEKIPTFEEFLRVYKTCKDSAIGTYEDEKGERLSISILPESDQVVYTFVGKVDEEEFFRNLDFSRSLVEALKE